MNLRNVGFKKTFDKFLQENFIKVMSLSGKSFYEFKVG